MEKDDAVDCREKDIVTSGWMWSLLRLPFDVILFPGRLASFFWNVEADESSDRLSLLPIEAAEEPQTPDAVLIPG